MKTFKLPMIAAAAMAVFLTLGAGTALAANWFVDPAGNDSNTCLAAGPSGACMTITAAIGKASNGDTLNVSDGIYHEQVNINKTLTLLGGQHGVDARTRSGAESIIDNSCSPVQITANSVVLDGFTVQGSTQVDPCTNVGIFMNPGGFGFAGGAQIVNNIVQNNIAGIEFDNSGSLPAKVQFNLIRNNNNPGPGSGNGIQSNFGLKNAVIDENTFLGHVNSSILMPGTGSSPITISNNTLDAGIVLFACSGIAIGGNTSIANTVDGTIYLGGGNSGVNLIANVLDNGVEAIVVEDPFSIGPNSNVTVSPNNCIAGNSMNGLRVGHLGYVGAAHSLNATNNWWGAASGPRYNGAGPGTGDKITDPDLVVSFTPFLTSRTGTPCAPPPVGPPTNKDQCKDGGWQTFNTPRTFKNQGDCVSFVNTGK